MGKLIDERIDAGVERIIKKHSKPATTRGGEPQFSLPGLIADIMFGKKPQQ